MGVSTFNSSLVKYFSHLFLDLNNTDAPNQTYSAIYTKPDRFLFYITADGKVVPADEMGQTYVNNLSRKAITEKNNTVSATRYFWTKEKTVSGNQISSYIGSLRKLNEGGSGGEGGSGDNIQEIYISVSCVCNDTTCSSGKMTAQFTQLGTAKYWGQIKVSGGSGNIDAQCTLNVVSNGITKCEGTFSGDPTGFRAEHTPIVVQPENARVVLNAYEG